MADTLRHRGPDDGNVWIDAPAGIALGHRRLSIIDLSAAGAQPMLSGDPAQRFVLAFNGEIYNHGDIRAEIERVKSVRYRGHSDTEVLVTAMTIWGVEQAIRRAVGMFAIAVWDRLDRRLWLARDRIGEKPLYYGWHHGTFLFGSELRALRAHDGWRGGLHRGALALFLRHSCVPSPYSIHEGIAKLPPGCAVEIGEGVTPAAVSGAATVAQSLAAGPVGARLHRFWSVEETVSQGLEHPFRGSDEEAVQRLDSILRSVIGQQMCSDVPLGAFLSGGVDSSAVAAVMQALSNRKIRTFTIGFDDRSYDEAQHAKAVAAHLGAEHCEYYCGSADALDLVPRLPEIYDEPFADSSQLPTLLVCAMARRHVTVALSGDGGDEVFGGYNRYLWVSRIWRRIAGIPQPLRIAAAATSVAVPPGYWDKLARWPSLQPVGGQGAGKKIHKLATVLSAGSMTEAYSNLTSHWRPEDVMQDFTDAPPGWPEISAPNGLDSTRAMMFRDQIGYLPDDILVKVDRAAMFVSLETRVPFLDPEVVAFAWSQPSDRLIRGRSTKWLLRQVLYRYVPAALVERPKAGFAVPVAEWLRGPLRAWAEELLEERKLKAAGLRPGPIHRKWREHLAGASDWHSHLWDVLMLGSWLERYGA